MAEIEAGVWGLAAGITVLGGFVKGVVGFAMPLVMVSGMASFLPVETAIAAMILPTLVANLLQVLRDGPAEAVRSAQRFRLFLTIVIVSSFFSAQLVWILPSDVLLLLLGGVVLGFVTVQLSGWRMRVRAETQRRTEVGMGIAAGGLGGFTGSWGPPTVMLLTALEVSKREHVRVQGAVYLLGALTLTIAHVQSGVLSRSTAVLSTAMVLPGLIGMWLGFKVHDRIDAELFRRLTLIVLLLVGLNLLRRGLTG